MEWVERVDITRETLWVRSQVIDELLSLKRHGGNVQQMQKRLRKYAELQGVPATGWYKVTDDVYDV